MTAQDEAIVEKFAPNGGRVISVLGGVVAAAFILVWALDPHDVPLWVPAAALLVAGLLYVSTVRPRVLVRGRDLVLRNMLSTTLVPLAAIDDVAVRQVMHVRVGPKRYVASGVGRPLRQAVRGGPGIAPPGELTPVESIRVVQEGMNYADFVELRITELANEDRTRRGIGRYTPEADALAEQVRREPAWRELGLLLALAVLLALTIALA